MSPPNHIDSLAVAGGRTRRPRWIWRGRPLRSQPRESLCPCSSLQQPISRPMSIKSCASETKSERVLFIALKGHAKAPVSRRCSSMLPTAGRGPPWPPGAGRKPMTETMGGIVAVVVRGAAGILGTIRKLPLRTRGRGLRGAGGSGARGPAALRDIDHCVPSNPRSCHRRRCLPSRGRHGPHRGNSGRRRCTPDLTLRCQEDFARLRPCDRHAEDKKTHVILQAS